MKKELIETKIIHPISLIKRLRLYLVLFLISVVVLSIFPLGREFGYLFDVTILLLHHYVFGVIFLKTKWIFKFIIPFITTVVSVGTLWCLIWLFLQTEFDLDKIMSILFFPTTVIIWEIAYQILIGIKINH